MRLMRVFAARCRAGRQIRRVPGQRSRRVVRYGGGRIDRMAHTRGSGALAGWLPTQVELMVVCTPIVEWRLGCCREPCRST